MNKNYIFYYTFLTRLLATGIIPIIYLVITNTIILLKIKKGIIESENLQETINKSKQILDQVPRRRSESKAGLTLTGIVLVYLICNLPRLVLNLVEYLLLSQIYKVDQCGCNLAPWLLSSLIRSSQFLITLNSSVNFLIYISVSKGFKKIFKFKLKTFLNRFRNPLLNLRHVEICIPESSIFVCDL